MISLYTKYENLAINFGCKPIIIIITIDEIIKNIICFTAQGYILPPDVEYSNKQLIIAIPKTADNTNKFTSPNFDKFNNLKLR